VVSECTEKRRANAIQKYIAVVQPAQRVDEVAGANLSGIASLCTQDINPDRPQGGSLNEIPRAQHRAEAQPIERLRKIFQALRRWLGG